MFLDIYIGFALSLSFIDKGTKTPVKTDLNSSANVFCLIFSEIKPCLSPCLPIYQLQHWKQWKLSEINPFTKTFLQCKV